MAHNSFFFRQSSQRSSGVPMTPNNALDLDQDSQEFPNFPVPRNNSQGLDQDSQKFLDFHVNQNNSLGFDQGSGKLFPSSLMPSNSVSHDQGSLEFPNFVMPRNNSLEFDQGYQGFANFNRPRNNPLSLEHGSQRFPFSPLARNNPLGLGRGSQQFSNFPMPQDESLGLDQGFQQFPNLPVARNNYPGLDQAARINQVDVSLTLAKHLLLNNGKDSNLFMKNFRKQVQTDCLSSLHDDLLIHILSFVDIKHAAQTCVLSKRWNNKNLWRNHPDVYLDSTTFGQNSDKFKEYVDMVLAQRDELHLKLRSFSFTWTFESMIPQELLDKVHVYAQDHDVRHFSLTICSDSLLSYPSRIFTSKSLATLRLKMPKWYGAVRFFFSSEFRRLYLSGCTALKTLWLENFALKSSIDGQDLFSGLVDLTELHIIGCFIIEKDGCFLISAPRLERLTVLESRSASNVDVPRWKISSPVLKYLKTDLCLRGPPRKLCVRKWKV